MTIDLNVGLLRQVGLAQSSARPAPDPASQGQRALSEGVPRSGAAGESAAAQQARAGPAAAAGREQATGNLSPQEIDAAVGELNDLAQSIRRELKFSVDDASGRPVIEVYDANTEELIRQIPPEQVLNVLRQLKEFDSGLLQEKA
ncbi:MAG: flagellar protein FlaG [Gammaproteobacteria bacterium]|nr:flagellar protein FlaG [Gammaproteobacteria bacterium]